MKLFEVKSKKTGRLVEIMTEEQVQKLKESGLFSRFRVEELAPAKTIIQPIDYEMKITKQKSKK